MISYRQALPSDATAISKLLLEVSFISRFLYNSIYPQDKWEEKIALSFQSEQAKNSYKNIYVAVTNDNHVVGLINFYDYTLHKIDDSMRANFPAHVLDELEPLYASVLPDSLYVAALIVEEAYRSHQIGLKLLAHVKGEAKKANYKQICLHVWDDNQRGIQFYKKNNFIFYDRFKLDVDSIILPPSKTIWLTGVGVEE